MQCQYGARFITNSIHQKQKEINTELVSFFFLCLTYKYQRSIIVMLNLIVIEVFLPHFPTVNLRNPK